MKGKIAIGCALTILMATNTFAFEIYKGKLIKEKKWTTDNGITATFRDSHALRSTGVTQKGASTLLEFSKGTVGQSVAVEGDIYAYIDNNTDQTKTYLFSTKLCVDTSSQTSRCSFYDAEIEVEPSGYFRFDKENIMQLVFNKAGEYRSESEVGIRSQNQIESNFSGTASSTILISDEKKA